MDTHEVLERSLKVHKDSWQDLESSWIHSGGSVSIPGRIHLGSCELSACMCAAHAFPPMGLNVDKDASNARRDHLS